ncbi:hypothetical protein [Pseudomonas sp. NBRC 111140]|uniref:hypothetical protein n=1 Tax=Pseudomonas sp. NBRC 111140 TaxID=1661055 RepID=UPI00076210E5|nr:hypothetical protein [Pseudomonas sp. NBRC 111140]
MSDQEHDVLADVAAYATGTVGMPDIDMDHPVADSLADDVERYAEHAERRDQHLAEDADPDAVRDAAPQRQAPSVDQQHQAELRAMAEQLTALHQQNVQLQQHQLQVQQFLAQQQQAQIPNFEDDPQGHVEAVQAQMQQQLQAVQQQVQAQQYEAQLRGEMAAAAPDVTASENAMREEVGGEAYDAAYQHVHQYAQAELARMYPGANPAMLAQLEQVAGVAFVQQCRQQGIDPARHIYEKAQALGFAPGQRVPGGDQPRKAPNTSLSTVPAAGRAPDQRGRLTAKDVASMSNDEFDQLFESMKRSATPMPF